MVELRKNTHYTILYMYNYIVPFFDPLDWIRNRSEPRTESVSVLIKRLCDAFKCSKRRNAPSGSKLCNRFLDTSAAVSSHRLIVHVYRISMIFIDIPKFHWVILKPWSQVVSQAVRTCSAWWFFPRQGTFKNCSWSHCRIFTNEVKLKAMRSHLNYESAWFEKTEKRNASWQKLKVRVWETCTIQILKMFCAKTSSVLWQNSRGSAYAIRTVTSYDTIWKHESSGVLNVCAVLAEVATVHRHVAVYRNLLSVKDLLWFVPGQGCHNRGCTKQSTFIMKHRKHKLH